MKNYDAPVQTAIVNVKKSVSIFQGAFAFGVAVLLGACSSGSDNDDNGGLTPIPPPAAVPFQELIDQGVTRYMGVYSPSTTTEVGNTLEHTFGAGDGPLCLTGTPYTMATRDSGSEALLIFLQGGALVGRTFSPATNTPEINCHSQAEDFFLRMPPRVR